MHGTKFTTNDILGFLLINIVVWGGIAAFIVYKHL